MDKKEIIKKIITAFECQDFSEVRDYFTQDFVMHWPGVLSIEKLDDLELFLKRNSAKSVVETRSEHFVEKENVVFSSGETVVELHSGLLVKNYFCDIYEFKEAKISKITSYILHDK